MMCEKRKIVKQKQQSSHFEINTGVWFEDQGTEYLFLMAVCAYPQSSKRKKKQKPKQTKHKIISFLNTKFSSFVLFTLVSVIFFRLTPHH